LFQGSFEELENGKNGLRFEYNPMVGFALWPNSDKVLGKFKCVNKEDDSDFLIVNVILQPGTC